MAVGHNIITMAISIAAGGCGTVYLVRQLWPMLRDGEINPGDKERATHPVRFWYSMAWWFGLLAMAIIAVAGPFWRPELYQ